MIVLLLGAVTLSGCDTATTNVATDADDGLQQCLDLGFVPDTFDMDRCLAADTRAQRLVLVDQATYGTF